MTRSNTSPGHSGADQKSDRRRSGRAQRDHILDPYKRVAKPAEPAVCPQCHAIYRHGRWQWSDLPTMAGEMMCPACHRINDRYPAGVVTLTGAFIAAHKDEISRLARNQETAEQPEHPLNRIIGIEDEAPDRLVISTTDIHLPRRIGEAVERAYDGTLDEHFDAEGYFVRVNWHRDE
jgi:hypothetical protein